MLELFRNHEIKDEFILETRQKIFSAMAGKLNLNFGVIGWCRQDSLAGENSTLQTFQLWLRN